MPNIQKSRTNPELNLKINPPNGNPWHFHIFEEQSVAIFGQNNPFTFLRSDGEFSLPYRRFLADKLLKRDGFIGEIPQKTGAVEIRSTYVFFSHPNGMGHARIKEAFRRTIELATGFKATFLDVMPGQEAPLRVLPKYDLLSLSIREILRK